MGFILKKPTALLLYSIEQQGSAVYKPKDLCYRSLSFLLVGIDRRRGAFFVCGAVSIEEGIACNIFKCAFKKLKKRNHFLTPFIPISVFELPKRISCFTLGDKGGI